jgi:hypothetical protein
MICKTFEVRDRGTCMSVLAIRLTPTDERDRFLLARAGYGRTADKQSEYVLLIDLVKAPHDPYGHDTSARTIPRAHAIIRDAFDTLENGAVVDIEYLLKETEAPKESEEVSHPL